MLICILIGWIIIGQDICFSVKMYSGEENPLIISRVYYTNFICDFNLVLYPFDRQHCDMHLRILSASKKYITVDEMATSAKYSGSELLLEYEVRC